MRLTTQLLLRLTVVTWFCVSQFMVSVNAVAQSIDVEPPVIEHDVSDPVNPAERQSFFATVADDDELASVRFLYRFDGEINFTSIDMVRVSYSSTFTVQVATDIDDGRAIQYYIEARDVSGNRTLRGYNFSPLIRAIKLPEPVVVPPQAEAPVESATNRKPIYYVVGALVLGAVVGALANSGGSTEGPSGSCVDGICGFTVTWRLG